MCTQDIDGPIQVTYTVHLMV